MLNLFAFRDSTDGEKAHKIGSIMEKRIFRTIGKQITIQVFPYWLNLRAMLRSDFLHQQNP
jgi:hypothetical protein